MPAIAYLIYIMLMVAAVIVSRSYLVAAYLVIGYILANFSIEKVLESEEWVKKHSKWDTAGDFGLVLILWPIYLIICIIMFIIDKR